MRVVPVAHSGYHNIVGLLDGNDLYLLDAAPALYAIYDGELYEAPMPPRKTWKNRFSKGWETQVLIPDNWKEIPVPYGRDDLFWKNWYVSKIEYSEWFSRVPNHIVLHDYHALTVRLVNLERYRKGVAYDASLKEIGTVYDLPFEGRKRRVILLDKLIKELEESVRIEVEDGKFLVLNREYPQVNWFDDRKNGIIQFAFPEIPRAVGIRAVDENGNLVKINLELANTGWDCFSNEEGKPLVQSGHDWIEIRKEGDLYIFKLENNFKIIKDVLIC